MFGIGFPELILILIIGLVVFGPGKLPEIGRLYNSYGICRNRSFQIILCAVVKIAGPVLLHPHCILRSFGILSSLFLSFLLQNVFFLPGAFYSPLLCFHFTYMPDETLLFFLIRLNNTLMFLIFFTIINPNQQNITCIILNRIRIFSILYLLQCTHSTFIPFQFHNKRRIITLIFRFWNKHKIRKASSCRYPPHAPPLF